MSVKHDVNVNFRVKYVYIGLVFILVFGLVLFFCMSQYEIEYGLLEIIGFVTGLTATLTLIFHSLNLENQILTQKKNYLMTRTKYTYDMISEWHHPSMMPSVNKTRELLKNDDRIKELSSTSTIESFAQYLKTNQDDRKHLILVLNYFENISTLMGSDHVDKEIIKKSFKSLFMSYYEALEHYINFRQKEHPDSWYYFECISKEWRQERKTA